MTFYPANHSTKVESNPPEYSRVSCRPALAAARIATIYALVGGLWILFSDKILFALVPDPATAARVGILKGWFYVAATAGLLFWSLRRCLEQTRESDDRLSLSITHAPAAIAMLDRDLRYIAVSGRWAAEFGPRPVNLCGRLHHEVCPDISEGWHEVNRRVLAGETVRAEAEKCVRADGSVQWLRWEIHPWFVRTGVIGGVVILNEDITARKQADEALVESQSRLRLALVCGQVGTWSWDLSTGTIECDETVSRILGRPRAEILHGGLDYFSSCLHPDDRSVVQEELAAAVSSGSDFAMEYRLVRPDGSIVWLADRGRVICDSTGKRTRMLGACVDVTIMKRIERELHETEDRFREVVETIQEVFWISDVARNRILYVSPGYETIWGRSRESLYANGHSWLEAIHPEDRDRVLKADLARQSVGTYDETFRIIRPDQSICWIRDRAYPVRDATGIITRVVGTAEDITEQKKVEERFLRAQRLEAIGALAGGVAHDLNNILAPMLMAGPLLRPKIVDSSALNILSIVERSAERGRDVVKQLLTFARGIENKVGALQVRHLVKEMMAIMSETFPREISLANQIPTDLWPMLGDATQVHQVLMNLCVNARDAMPEGGRLVIKARNARLDTETVRPYAGCNPGRFVILTVSDTGEGISKENQKRIFEPFFTTKGIGKGTGLGLSTVFGIAKSHGGFVTLESELGKGTSFHIHIPAADVTEPDKGVSIDEPKQQGCGQTVLIVDDEASIRLAVQMMLEEHGYRVLSAEDGSKGLRTYLDNQEDIHCVVTDLMMPGMNGFTLSYALHEVVPGLPIVACTGLDQTHKREALAKLGVTELLAKPYSADELLGAIKRATSKSTVHSLHQATSL